MLAGPSTGAGEGEAPGRWVSFAEAEKEFGAMLVGPPVDWRFVEMRWKSSWTVSDFDSWSQPM